MTNPIQDKHILLGVTGSIAAYKAVELASRLTQAGAQVDIIMTQSAIQFVAPLTFQSVTGRDTQISYCLRGVDGLELAPGHVLHVRRERSHPVAIEDRCS